MASFRLQGMMVLLLSLVSGLAAASVMRNNGIYSESAVVVARQDEGALNSCIPSCELDSCGLGLCPLASSALGRRSVGALSFPDGYTPANDSSPGLDKRLFRLDTTADIYSGYRHPTIGEISHYLPQVFNGGEIPYFGVPASCIIDGSEGAVMRQRAFGDQPFQFMTGGIHGCTMVTLVSRRAVWQAHFWEVYSHGGDSSPLDSTRNTAFRQRVLDAMAGKPVRSPATVMGNRGVKPYVAPVGDAIDPDLFNRDDDDTRLYISVPTPKGSRDVRKQRRPKRNSELKSMVEEIVGKAFPSESIVPYVALNTDDPREREMMNKSHRGLYLFQYDPDSDGNGQKAWRLFLEASWTSQQLG